MEIKQLKYFSEIVKYGSFNKASQAIFVSQPYLTNVVKDLEAELDVRLVERSRKGISLTSDGEKLLCHANKILNNIEQLKSSFSSLDNDKIEISVSVTGFCSALESFISICKDNLAHENFTFSLREGKIGEVIEDVRNNTSQIGIIYKDIYLAEGFSAYLEGKNLKFYPLTDCCPCVILNKRHPLYFEGRKEIDIEQLRGFGFISCDWNDKKFPGSLIVNKEAVLLEKWSKQVHMCKRDDALRMLEKTDFFSIGLDVEKSYENLDLARLTVKDCNNSLTLGYILKNEEEISPATENFIRLLTKELA